jgi:Tol biopolymer transport system component
MKPFVLPHSQRVSLRPSISIASCLVACLVVWIWLVLRGCMNEHYRPHGHGNISFGISSRGNTLVFNAVGLGERDLYLLDLETHRVTRIAPTPDYEVDPEFSPDGKSVVYAAGKPGDRADHIFLRSLDGQMVKQLTAEDANDASPAFSPDGSLIVFARDKTYNWGGLASNWDWGGVLCVMKADGTDLREITNDGSIAIDPHFSSDGKTILFWSDDPARLYSIATDGSQPPKPLGGFTGREAVYSPDGQAIAFASGFFAPDQRISIARADGTGREELMHPGEGKFARPDGGCSHPTFTPDGKRILFFVESWPSGSSGHPTQSLWEVEIGRGNRREIADSNLFDGPLNRRPAPPIQKEAP